ncbi:acyl-CoA dehydrogenase family protein [Streptomyces sp. WG-D5]
MDLLPTPDQAAVSAAVAEVLGDRAPLDVARTYRPRDGGEAPGWAALSEMGLFGLAIPENCGGAGFGLPEQVLAFVELGRALATGPLLGTTLAAHLAADAGEKDLAAAFGTGERSAAVAVPEVMDLDEGDPSMDLRVTDASAAWVVVATPRRSVLVARESLQLEPVPSLDPSVALATASPGDRDSVVAGDARTWWRGTVLNSAQMVGVSDAALADAVQYAKVREQFGQVIGAFQAVKHRCAEMATRTEAARWQTSYASLVDLTEPDVFALHAASARIVAAEAARLNAADNIVTHGAMGFSDESAAHLFARRVAVHESQLGPTRWFVESVAAGEPVG